MDSLILDAKKLKRLKEMEVTLLGLQILVTLNKPKSKIQLAKELGVSQRALQKFAVKNHGLIETYCIEERSKLKGNVGSPLVAYYQRTEKANRLLGIIKPQSKNHTK